MASAKLKNNYSFDDTCNASLSLAKTPVRDSKRVSEDSASKKSHPNALFTMLMQGWLMQRQVHTGDFQESRITLEALGISCDGEEHFLALPKYSLVREVECENIVPLFRFVI